jgi:WD40 repeat protein
METPAPVDSAAAITSPLRLAPNDLTVLRKDGGAASPAGAVGQNGPGWRTGAGAPAIPGFEVLEELGRGGMGVVYKARHVGLDRVVALKMILAGAHAHGSEVVRFQTEARTIARLQHPNIVEVHEVGEHEGKPYLCLEFCAGGSLARKLNGTPLPAAEAAQLVEVLARATQAAHDRNVIHRDLKPANVLLTEAGTPKITDFGLARQLDDQGQTATGAVLGTPSYMAPEQAGGKTREVGPLIDVYALGAILYECLTGRPPFKSATPLDTLLQVADNDPVPPTRLQPKTPKDLETICLKCLQKEPAKRYGSARELAEELRRFQAGEPIRARPVTGWERARKWARRQPATATLIAVSLVAAVTLLGGGTWFTLRLHRANKEAEAARQTALETAEESRTRLVRLCGSTGNNYAEAGDWWTALLWYNRAWEADHGHGEAAGHRLRLAAILERCPRLVGVCFHTRRLLDATVDPAGRRILTRTEGHAFLWDPQRSEMLAELRHEGGVHHAALAGDGKQVATAGKDGQVRLWDATDGKLLRSLSHPAAVQWAAFSPDGSTLASACADGFVRLWQTDSGSALPVKIATERAALFVAFNPDGTRLLTADAADRARVWNAATGQPLSPPLAHRMQPGGSGPLAPVLPAFSPDGRWALSVHNPAPPGVAQNAALHFWQADGETLSTVTLPFGANQVTFSPDSKQVLALGTIARASVLQVPDGKAVLGLVHPREVQRGCFSPDGKLIATASSGGLVQFWDRQTGRPAGATRAGGLGMNLRHVEPLTQLTFSPDGRSLLSASQDGTARLWQLPPPEVLGRPYDFDCGRAHLAGAWADRGRRITLSPDGRRELRFGGKDGATIHHRPGGEAGPVLRLEGTVKDARFSADGQRVLTLAGDEVRVWDADTGEAIGPAFKVNSPLYAPQLSGDGSRLAAVDGDRVVYLWEVDSGRTVLEPFRVPLESGQPLGAGKAPPQRPSAPTPFRQLAIALSENGRYLAAASLPGPSPGVWITDVEAGTTVHVPLMASWIQSVELSPDGRHLLTASSDTTARVWESATGKPAGPPLHHPIFARRAAFRLDGRYVATADAAANVRVWDGFTGDLLVPPLPAHAGGEPRRVWFSQDGRRVIFHSKADRFVQWDLPLLAASTPLSADLMRLLAGQEIDETEGIAFLPGSLFRDHAERFRNAWVSWSVPR